MKRILLIAIVISLISSCGHVISKSVREHARADIPFSSVKENIDKYKGMTFILGGVIVATRNTDEGSTIEAMQTPINRYGTVIDPDDSSGRFMAVEKGYLDPLIYKKGREITIAGELIGSRKKQIGEIEYAYPLFKIKEIYLWREARDYYPYYPVYSPFYRYRYPYWWHDPWWHRHYYSPPY